MHISSKKSSHYAFAVVRIAHVNQRSWDTLRWGEKKKDVAVYVARGETESAETQRIKTNKQQQKKTASKNEHQKPHRATKISQFRKKRFKWSSTREIEVGEVEKEKEEQTIVIVIRERVVNAIHNITEKRNSNERVYGIYFLSSGFCVSQPNSLRIREEGAKAKIKTLYSHSKMRETNEN